MDQTTRQIVHYVHNQREDLDRNLRDLESKLKEVTSWQLQFQKHRSLFLGAAFAGGMMLAVVLGRPFGRNTSHPRSHAGLKSARRVA